jgi:hypothetical protein
VWQTPAREGLNMMRRAVVAATVLTLGLGLVGPAGAEVVTRTDPEPKCSQAPPLDVKRATFNYAKKKFVWRIKVGEASKKHTRVIGRYSLTAKGQTTYDVMIQTSYDARGKKRVVGRAMDYVKNEDRRFTKGVTAAWDFKRDVITITLTSHMKGKRADAWAYSVEKGELHGPPCGDYIWSGRIRRG